MATIFIPTMLQEITHGTKKLELDARTVRQVVDELGKMYPGIQERLLDANDIREGLAVVVDGGVSVMGMLTKVSQTSEVHFVPAIGGGEQ